MTLYQIPVVLSQYILDMTQDPILILLLISVFLTFYRHVDDSMPR